MCAVSLKLFHCSDTQSQSTIRSQQTHFLPCLGQETKVRPQQFQVERRWLFKAILWTCRDVFFACLFFFFILCNSNVKQILQVQRTHWPFSSNSLGFCYHLLRSSTKQIKICIYDECHPCSSKLQFIQNLNDFPLSWFAESSLYNFLKWWRK